MTLTRRARDLVLVATLLAVPLLVLRANLTSEAHLNAVDRAVLRGAAPLQAGVTAVARGTGRVWSRYLALVHVKEDNARLATENAELRSQLAAAEERARRGPDLERLLGLRAALGGEVLAARVIGVETSPFFRVVRVKLDRGAEEVKPGMAVLAAAGVVGRVQHVFGAYCDVLLAVDPKSSIDVVVSRTNGRGVLKGIVGDNRYRTRIEYLDRKDEVAEGDLVVTSGLGGAFPRDLPVGRIVKVAKKSFGLYQDAEVQPAVDFGKLTEVLVVAPSPETAGPKLEAAKPDAVATKPQAAAVPSARPEPVEGRAKKEAP